MRKQQAACDRVNRYRAGSTDILHSRITSSFAKLPRLGSRTNSEMYVRYNLTHLLNAGHATTEPPNAQRLHRKSVTHSLHIHLERRHEFIHPGKRGEEVGESANAKCPLGRFGTIVTGLFMSLNGAQGYAYVDVSVL